MCIAIILFGRMTLSKRLKINFSVKKNKHIFYQPLILHMSSQCSVCNKCNKCNITGHTHQIALHIFTINSSLSYTAIHNVLLFSFVTSD